MNEISIREWIKRFDNGDFSEKDVKTQINAGWYDWFCKDNALQCKTYKLAKYLKEIINSHKIDIDKQYVFFKNNCTDKDKLYDDFRICDINTGNVFYTVIPRSGHKFERYERAQVWGIENNFIEPLISGTWKNVKEWFFKSEEENNNEE